MILRHGVAVENPATVVIGLLDAFSNPDLGEPLAPASFGEPDLRLANRMGARISAAQIAAVLERRRAIERALEAIAPDASLAAAQKSVPWPPLRQLFDAFSDLHGVGFSKMTKALHRKRPALIPMLDSAVQAYLADDELGADAAFGARGIALVRGYKRDLDSNRVALRSLRRELARGGVRAHRGPDPRSADLVRDGRFVMAARGGRERGFPLGAAITLAELSGADPHPTLARLRADEPVSWVPALDGWLVTRHDLAVAVMSDARGFTVEDPRFSTAQVIGPSMLSLDGEEHTRHRAPFVGPFRAGAVAEGFADTVSGHVDRLLGAVAPDGRMELRRQFAARFPLRSSPTLSVWATTRSMASCGNTTRSSPSVTSITAGEGPTAEGAEAFSASPSNGWNPRSQSTCSVAARRSGRRHRERTPAGARPNRLQRRRDVVRRDRTTEGMITNAALELLRRPDRSGPRRKRAGGSRRTPGRIAAPRARGGRDRPLRDRYLGARRSADRAGRARPDLDHRREPRSGRFSRSGRVRSEAPRRGAAWPLPRGASVSWEFAGLRLEARAAIRRARRAASGPAPGPGSSRGSSRAGLPRKAQRLDVLWG